MAETPESLPAVAFQYNGTDVLFDANRLVSLTDMWKAAGSPVSQSPKHWKESAQGKGFIGGLAANLNSGISAVYKSTRGKHGGGTWAHWQIALAYAKYLSHGFHRYVNEAFREWAEEKADPFLKADRAADAMVSVGMTEAWAAQRLKSKGVRNLFTGTLADHNCKVKGSDNPFAEATRTVALVVIGKTPREFKADKGLAKSAPTRSHYTEQELIETQFVEISAVGLIKEESADGNDECLERVQRAAAALKLAKEAMKPKPGKTGS